MSADNWGICPKCKRKAEKNRQEAMQKAAEAYGKIPAAEWQAMSEAANKPVKLEPSFREDFEQGMNTDGSYSVTYRGSCQTESCGFRFTYDYEKQVLKNE